MDPLLPGVFKAQKKDGTLYYRSNITYRRKHISLGSFPCQETAHKAYLEAGRLLQDNTLKPEDYPQGNLLTFEKWVILCNFRDNRLYLSTPIYVRPRFFNYYLNPQTVLKFDIDDLFYYSSRKILQRGGHMFVSDYGMQVNILNRYGIKNYGVAGRDYIFINGDDTDFRYENIEIINRYYGVFRETVKNKTVYKSKIHIKSTYVIGSYETEEEAAIAYNKAVDLLKAQGIKRNFAVNYLENVSPSKYADIYSALNISPRIRHFKNPPSNN